MKKEIQVKKEKPRGVSSLSYDESVSIVFDFFQGDPISSIIKKYNLKNKKTVTTLLNTHGQNQIQTTAGKVLEMNKVRESDRITTIKNSAYDVIEKAMVDSKDLNGRELLDSLTKIKDILGKIDEIQRLNNNDATQNIKTENTTKHIDITEIMKQLPTQEDKLRFLQGRFQHNDDRDTNN